MKGIGQIVKEVCGKLMEREGSNKKGGTGRNAERENHKKRRLMRADETKRILERKKNTEG